MSKKLLNSTNFNSQIFSSFQSSSSFLKFDEDQSMTDSRVPQTVDTLETGLTMVLDENFVKNVWSSGKQREALQDLFFQYMRREGILKNFEKMELLLIADYHLYNLIFAKEELGLDNFRTAILLNVMWTLLKNSNPNYDATVLDNDGNEVIRKEAILAQKSLESDLAAFKEALVNHCLQNPPRQHLYFTPQQLQVILKHAYSSYIDKFDLFNYVFVSKDQKEEVRLMVDISDPEIAPPLKTALFMGFDYQPIVTEREDIIQDMGGSQLLKVSMDQGSNGNVSKEGNGRGGTGSRINSAVSRNSGGVSGSLDNGGSGVGAPEEEMDPSLRIVQEKVTEAKGVFEDGLRINDQKLEDNLSGKNKSSRRKR